MKCHAAVRAAGLALALLVLLEPMLFAGQAADKIFQKGAVKPLLVRITAESIDGIKAGSAEFNPIGIARIEYADSPHSFNEGVEHHKLGRYEEAIRFFEAAFRSDARVVRHFWLHPACRYYIALCYLEDGSDLAAAEAKFRELLTNHPTTRWLPEAMLGLGRVQFEAKKYDGALTEFEQLSAKAVQKNWEEWLYRSYLWKGRTLLEKKDHPAALASVRKITEAAAGNPRYKDIVIQAKVIEATIHVRSGDYKRAAGQLRALIKEIGPAVGKEIEGGTDSRMRRTEAQCYNALGHCFLKQAAQTKKEDDYREALLAFLWTVVMHQRLPAEHAEALNYGATCFEKLKDRSRATQLRNELAERYPDSPYVRKLGTPGTAASKKENAK